MALGNYLTTETVSSPRLRVLIEGTYALGRGERKENLQFEELNYQKPGCTVATAWASAVAFVNEGLDSSHVSSDVWWHPLFFFSPSKVFPFTLSMRVY